MFSQLESSAEARNRRKIALMCGVVAQLVAIAVMLLLSVMFPQALPMTKQYMLAWIPPIEPPKPPPPPQPPPIHLIHKMVIPKMEPLETPKLVAPPEVKVKPPKIEPVVLPKALPAPPPLISEAVAPPPKPKDPIVVHTGTFGGSPEKVTLKKPPEQVQTGGFGSPEGFKGKAQGDSLGNVPKLGSFGLPEGPGVGNGTGGKHGAQGVIASAGFGSGVAGPGSGSGTGNGGPVAVGKFEQERETAPAPGKAVAAPAPVDFTPIEIISKPTPTYTEEARRLGIQGDVALSVVFLANGSIRITGVVKSLGHGLDEEAQAVAARIRFKPAMRAGQPADFPATVRIEFRLAGQASS